MKIKTTVITAVLMLVLAIQAQDVAKIFNDLKSPQQQVAAPVSEPAPAVIEAAPAVAVTAPASVVGTAPAAAGPAAASAEEVVETIMAKPEPAAGATMKGGLISVSLKEVELNSVIRLFATLSAANIIVPAMEGDVGTVKVDVNLKDVEWKPALQAILETQSLELYEKNPGTDVYSVRKKLADAPAAMNVKTFKLNFATVSAVNDMIKNMVPDSGKISLFPARNTIVVQSTPENLAEIQMMIAAIDLPRQQVFIEAKFMELTDSASEKLGIDWQVLGGYGVGVKGIGGTYNYADSKKDGINNSSSVGGNRYTDIAGRPYENMTAEPTTLDSSGNPIIDYPARPGSSDPNATRSFGVTPTTVSKTINGVTSVDDSTVARTLGATMSASDFGLVLAALKETTGAKVVSNPKVIVANEETATIHIGKKKPNVRGTSQTAGDSQRVTTYGLDDKEPYFEDGIKVNVTPTINTSSNITVKIQPTLDRLETDAQAFTAPDGTRFYGKSTKTITTLFSLGDGQTAAIGGLTQTSSDDIERKVPILGSIPLIGRLFSYSAKTRDQVETVIFVTVGLANPEHIDMSTGLPEESSLTMRQNAKMKATRQIKAEELRLIETQETEQAKQTVEKLQNAEQERLQKKK